MTLTVAVMSLTVAGRLLWARSVPRTMPDACAEDGCTAPAAVRLHVPWAEDRELCVAHARALVQRDGVVAEPLADADAEWP